MEPAPPTSQLVPAILPIEEAKSKSPTSSNKEVTTLGLKRGPERHMSKRCSENNSIRTWFHLHRP